MTHMDTAKHKKAANGLAGNSSLSKFGFKPTGGVQCNVIRAETLYSVFVAEHNIPFAVADHFTKICKQMFPDSDIAKKFACGKTKTTQIIKRALAPSCDKTVEQLCQTYPFSIMCDESNDRGNDKNFVILVRVFDDNVGQVVTQFLDMPVCNRATGENLFGTLNAVFENRGLKWENVVGYCSDNASVMVGRHNSVLSRIRNHQPSVFNLGCICHLANLCAGHAVKQLPVPVNDLLVDIFYHFKHSSLRKETLKEFQDFTDTAEEKILKHVTTRWLSLEKCIHRTLSQWPALQSYFTSHNEVEKPGKIHTIAKHLQSIETRLYFLFLDFILTPLNEFNTTFQTDAVKIVQLDGEMRRLLRKFLGKFVQVQVIKQNSLTNVPFDNEENQLPDHLLAVGMRARATLSEDEVDPNVQARFFSYVRKFYCAVVSKMLSKFPFENTVLRNIQWLSPTESDKVSAESVSTCASQLIPAMNTDAVQEEFVDFQLAENLPSASDKTVDRFWFEVGEMKDVRGNPRFPLLSKLAKAALCIPNSNADSERVFSMVKKIYTESRDSLANDTLVALLSTKVNMSGDCYDVQLSDQVLKDAKQATLDYNNEHPSCP